MREWTARLARALARRRVTLGFPPGRFGLAARPTAGAYAGGVIASVGEAADWAAGHLDKSREVTIGALHFAHLFIWVRDHGAGSLSPRASCRDPDCGLRRSPSARRFAPKKLLRARSSATIRALPVARADMGTRPFHSA
jgi:hypothetical protein